MPALAELQHDFGRALRDEACPPPTGVVGGAFPAAARLRVYRNNHRVGLRRALADCYPLLARLTGEGFFAWLAHAYLEVHPSRSGNLHELGAALPAFLADFAGAADHPWLVDVARLEWLRQEAYHAADHAPLDVAALAAVPANCQEELRFRLHPACRLLASRWPLLDIEAVSAQDADPEARADLDAGGEHLLVSRPRIDVLTESLRPGPFALLRALAGGEALGAACEQAVAAEPAMDLAGCVQAFIRARVLVAFERAG